MRLGPRSLFISLLVIGRSVIISLLGIFISNLKFILYVLQILLISSGSVEVNPRPNDKIFIHVFSPDPFRADKPLYAHNGGVCLYYKENISLKRRTNLEFLEETIVVELSPKNNKKLSFIVSYRHPNQSLDETESYFSSLNDIIEKIDNEKSKAIILTGDFNARSSFFWVNDADTTEGRILGEVSISNHLDQLVDGPTHIRDDGTTTCIDFNLYQSKLCIH